MLDPTERQLLQDARDKLVSANASFYTLTNFCLQDPGLQEWIDGGYERTNTAIKAIDTVLEKGV